MAEDANRLTWQVGGSAADAYEELFVPALFGYWAPRTVAAAGVQPGHRVLDVACGTGVCARAAADVAGDAGEVVGYDVNPGMLATAARIAPHLTWKQGPAESLPFDNSSFDSVVNQFALMFFEDRTAAVAEMYRVLRPGGLMAVAVWDGLERAPGYAALVDLIEDVCGSATADMLRAPFVMGDRTEIESTFAAAGLDGASIDTQDGPVQFPSIEHWVRCDVKASPMAAMVDDEQLATLLDRAETELREYRSSDGAVRFNSPAHIVTVVKD